MSRGRMTRRKFVQNAVAAAGVAAGLGAGTKGLSDSARSKTRSYNETMEYRRLGKTGLWISAVALGGHWKKLPYRFGTEEFKRNRRDLISACIDCGMNYVDACTGKEVVAYAEALRGRREKMYLGYSWYEHEMRSSDWQTAEKLLKGLEDGLREARLEYVDVWRITCYWQPSTDHSLAHEEAIVKALETARKAGKVRFCGISTHKHDWAMRMITEYPEQIEVVVVPYTAGSKKAHAGVVKGGGRWKPAPYGRGSRETFSASLIDSVKKRNVGWLGIKPFASGTIFRARGAVNDATKTIDDERARQTLRYVLSNDALTAPIPGMITVDQVKNAARAVTERRKLDLEEARRFDDAVNEMWAGLPQDYQWLKDWEYV